MNTNDTSHSRVRSLSTPLASSSCSVSRPEISRLSLPNEMLWADFYLWPPESLRRVFIRWDANGLFARSLCVAVSLWRNSIVRRLRLVSLRYTNWIGWAWRRCAPKTMAKIIQPWSRSMAARSPAAAADNDRCQCDALLSAKFMSSHRCMQRNCFVAWGVSRPNRWTSRHCKVMRTRNEHTFHSGHRYWKSENIFS